ncbi:hypothetical protein BANRA_00516 [Acinetobacter baumannii]|nr:hypothetical protein BANRA_00516 [Acinetobacter baumannii]
MDTIEAKKNLEIYKRNLSRLENYNHLFSSHTFKTECQREVNTQNQNREPRKCVRQRG